MAISLLPTYAMRVLLYGRPKGTVVGLVSLDYGLLLPGSTYLLGFHIILETFSIVPISQASQGMDGR